MKRKSILILAALVLAVSLPVFALAETAPALQPLDGTGYMYGRSQAVDSTVRGSRAQLQDCDLEDCDCDAEGTGLGNDGEALHQYATNGSGMMRNGAAVDNTQTFNQNSTGAGSRGGRGGSRWN